MLKIRNLILTGLIILGGISSSAQNIETYATSGMEMIFSFANVKINGEEQNTAMRWTPFLNFHFYGHADLNDRIGVFSGIAVRNIGFIYNDEFDNNNKHIIRSYNLGIPLGLKLGNMEKGFIYGGYEIEFPFHYKHKYWAASDRSGAKTKETSFFTGRTSSPMHTWFAGIQFQGINIKFKQYLTNFLNQKYTKDGLQPFSNYEANIFYISITANMTRNLKFYYFDD